MRFLPVFLDLQSGVVLLVGAGDLAGRGQGAIMPYWVVPSDGRDWSTHFVDLERDVTVADVRRALGTAYDLGINSGVLM